MLRKTVGTVGTLAQEAVGTAVSIARHPIGTASLAVGFAKGLAGTGIDLVRGPRSEAPTATPESAFVPEQATPAEPTPVPVTAVPDAPVEDPRDAIPGPDLAQELYEPPSPDDLPEPVVIEAADPAPGNGESGEPFHHEPKVASRDVEHGGPGTDFEEAEGFVEEFPEELRPE